MHITTFTGNIGDLKEPARVQETGDGTPYCVLPVAVNPPKGSDKANGDKPIWYRVTIWGRSAAVAAKYAVKGKPILVMGRPSVHEWVDRDGRNRYSLEISASHWEFIGDGLTHLFREAELVERESAVRDAEARLAATPHVEGGDAPRA